MLAATYHFSWCCVMKELTFVDSSSSNIIKANLSDIDQRVISFRENFFTDFGREIPAFPPADQFGIEKIKFLFKAGERINLDILPPPIQETFEEYVQSNPFSEFHYFNVELSRAYSYQNDS